MANKFQIVVSYLGRRYACFFIEKSIEFYGDLIYKIKEAIPYIGYKRLELEVREIDSPFVAKTRHEERVRCGESTTIKDTKV